MDYNDVEVPSDVLSTQSVAERKYPDVVKVEDAMRVKLAKVEEALSRKLDTGKETKEVKDITPTTTTMQEKDAVAFAAAAEDAEALVAAASGDTRAAVIAAVTRRLSGSMRNRPAPLVPTQTVRARSSATTLTTALLSRSAPGFRGTKTDTSPLLVSRV